MSPFALYVCTGSVFLEALRRPCTHSHDADTGRLVGGETRYLWRHDLHTLSSLDLSANALTIIDAERLCELKNLQFLYLHANQIHSLEGLTTLAPSLPKLRKLTLHGERAFAAATAAIYCYVMRAYKCREISVMHAFESTDYMETDRDTPGTAAAAAAAAAAVAADVDADDDDDEGDG